MNLLHGVGDFFSLDIGTNSMRIIQLVGDDKNGWTLLRYAYVPIEQRLTADDTDLGRKNLGESIIGAVEQAGINTKSVAVGLPASKTFTSIVETETLPEKSFQKFLNTRSTNTSRCLCQRPRPTMSFLVLAPMTP